MAQFHPYPAPEFTGEKDQPSDVLNSESGDLQFPGTSEEPTGLNGSMSRPMSQRGMRTKNQAQRLPSPAAQLFLAPHPHPPQTFPEQAATLHSPGPTSRDPGIPRRGGPAGNVGRLSPFQVTVPRSPAQDPTPDACPPARELSSGCWAEKV